MAVVASDTGLKQLAEAHPDVYISTGTVDTKITEEGVILPGIGDAGDRQFGTHITGADDDSESLVHPTKRKRENNTD